MGDFTEADFEKKLKDLRDSQKEIQSLSGFAVHHRKHCRSVVKVWYKCLKSFPANRKLTCMYFANDVVQNGRRKGPEYVKEFGSIMIKIFQYLSSVDFEAKTIGSLGRLAAIWQERQIFDKKILQEIGKIWTKKAGGGGAVTPAGGHHHHQRHKSNSGGDHRRRSEEERRKSTEIMDIDEMLESPLRKIDKGGSGHQRHQSGANPSNGPPPASAQLSVEERITLSPRMGSPGSGDPPEPLELITALQELENSASSDAEVREKIARLPGEVSEVSKIEAIQTSEEGRQILTQVEEASSLLTNYNVRLQDELKERRKVGLMVSEFLSAQKDLLAQSEERLEVYTEKLDRVENLKEELKSHIAALPDIPMIPGGGSMGNLPVGGDLFSR